MAIEIVIGIYLNQVNLIREVGSILSAVVYRHSIIVSAMDDDDGNCRGNGLRLMFSRR